MASASNPQRFNDIFLVIIEIGVVLGILLDTFTRTKCPYFHKLMITWSKHIATMEERVKNLQSNETDAEVSIIGLHEYKFGHVHYQPGYCPPV